MQYKYWEFPKRFYRGFFGKTILEPQVTGTTIFRGNRFWEKICVKTFCNSHDFSKYDSYNGG
mgnify:CR=1 FL=1